MKDRLVNSHIAVVVINEVVVSGCISSLFTFLIVVAVNEGFEDFS